MKKAALLLGFLSFWVTGAMAQFGSVSTYRFLNVPVSPQAAALGGAPVSLVHADPAQMHVNSAFLSERVSGSVSATFARFLTDVDMGFVSGIYHLPALGTVGGSLRFVNYGEFDRLDAAGNEAGTFSASDVAFKLALSRNYAGFIQYGVAVDLVHSSYESFQSTGLAFSGGVLLNYEEQDLSVGLSFVNAGTQLSTFDGVKETLPFDLRLGVSQKLQYLPLRLSFTAHSLHQWEMRVPGDEGDPSFFANLFRHLSVGGEFLFSESFHFRLGYNHFLHEELKSNQRIDLAGFGFGVGIRYKSVGFDFSRNSYSETGHMLQLGIQTRF